MAEALDWRKLANDDTGDDSDDEDLITSYLNCGNNANGVAGVPGGEGANFAIGPEGLPDDIIPSIHITSQTPNANHILEENLMQLAEIHENIQRMRIENANASRQTKGKASSRLSTSCPSLNREDEDNFNNGNVDGDLNSYHNDNESQNPAHRNHSTNNSANRAKRKNDPQQYRQKRMQGRQRSLSASSNDSDDFSQYSNPQQQQHFYTRNASMPGNGNEIDQVDAGPSQKSRPRSASSVGGGRGSFTVAKGHHHHHRDGDFVVPSEVPMPRPPSTKKTPHIFSQFPGLHKSVSTPSIVPEKNSRRTGGSSMSPLQEPTHDYLGKLLAAYEWTRKSGGSASESGDEDFRSIDFENRKQRFLHENSSPQISLAEFLQDVPNLNDDDQRKSRRKKERSSIFFRKKKDKSSTSASSSKSQFHQNLHTERGQTEVVKTGLSKAPSTSGFGSSKQHYRVPHHSYSMSSLRKPQTVASMSHQNMSSNFYVVSKGEASKFPYEDREEIMQEDTHGLIEAEFPLSMNEAIFPEGGPAAIRNLDTDPALRIEDPDEPESWQAACSRNQSSITGLSPVQIKRQEHIYEFIMTESNHCQVLKAVEKIFVNGMYKFLNMNKEIVDRIFPCLDQLLQLHFKFLEQLRARQYQSPIVDTIADILLAQFTGETAQVWREAYGTFCSQHNEAVSVYKELMKNSRTSFNSFVKQCTKNPLLKKKGIPECILFITTRITKYPLLIEPLIKTAKDMPQEQQKLKDAHNFIKDILKEVNAKVAEKDREQRFLDIYKGIDAKSSVYFKNRKFKKSDILSSSRKLMFEGLAILHQSRNRSVPVTVVVLSDILFFLQESNQKFYFFNPENKPPIIDVRTLLVQEKIGAGTKSLYIKSTSEQDSSEVYEIDIQQPPTREDWINGIKEAVDSCDLNSSSEEGFMENVYNEEAKKYIEDKYMKIRHFTAELREKDIELARVLEDKMRIMNDILKVLGHKEEAKFQDPNYLSLIRDSGSNSCTKEELLNAVQEASRLASVLYSTGSNSLARSVSSAGEKQSDAFTSSLLPKRAETFGGFDQQLQIKPSTPSEPESLQSSSTHEIVGEKEKSSSGQGSLWKGLPSVPPLLNLESEQQKIAVEMTHYLNTLFCMISENFTSLESVKAEMSEMREKRSYIYGGRYSQNQQLEEMKSLSESLAKEQEAWKVKKEAEKKELAQLQNEVNKGLQDVKDQRDQLYRKLEKLKAQGIVLGPKSVLKTDPVVSNQAQSTYPGELLYEKSANTSSDYHHNVSPSSIHHNSSTSSLRRNISPIGSSVATASISSSTLSSGGSLKKDSVSNLNLLSTTNEAKVEKAEIRQQIPVKLSSKLSVSTGSSKDKGGKKMSSMNSGVLKQAPLSNSAMLSGSMGNIAKPLVEGGVQQILPFKLSETESSLSSQGFRKGSPKQGYQKLQSSSHTQQHGGADHHQQHYQHHHQQQQQQLELSQQLQPRDSTFHQRTGSSPALMPQQQQPTPGNLLGANQEPNEDKVIYF